MKRSRKVLAILAVSAAAYWTWWFFPSATRFHVEEHVADILEQATSWELLSITSRHSDEMQMALDQLERSEPMPDGLFHWRTTLGSATVTDDESRRTLTRAFNRARRGWNHWSIFCWSPRHAIRASLPTGESVDLLICFECSQFRAFGPSGERLTQGTFRDRSSAAFDRVYRSLGMEVESRN